MESAQYIPMRAAIRSRAKQQMLANPETCELCAGLDDALMRELTVTLFNSDQYKTLYRQSRSSEETAEIAEQMATELVTNYRQIVQQKQNPTIQQLNMLL
jgi:Mg2+ and Co2+ transporter CorA